MPTTISTAPSTRNCRSRDVAGSGSRIAAISLLNCSTRSLPASPSTCVTALPSEICRAQALAQLVRAARHTDSSTGHDRSLVGHTEHDLGELLHDHDGDALTGERRDVLVELLDDERRETHRQLV